MNSQKQIPNTIKFSSQKKCIENNPFCNKNAFSTFLHTLVNAKNLHEPEVYNAAGIRKSTWSNIYSGLTCPDELTARQLVIGLQATYDEACEILKKCGYCWAETSFDKCIIDCLNKGIFSWCNPKTQNDVLSYIQNNAPEWLDGRFKKLAA